ncbi:hypothetical protein [Micromonospora sp. NPDC004704]
MAGPRDAAVRLLFRQYVRPVMAAHGVGGKGRTYRRFADSGDAVVVHFQNIALVPRPWLSWMRKTEEDSDLRDPYASEGVVETRLWHPGGDHQWSIGSVEAVHTHGPVLADLLSEQLGEFVALLDRDVFEERLRADADLPDRSRREAALVVLLTEKGPAPELEALLADFYDNGSGFPTWAWERAIGVGSGRRLRAAVAEVRAAGE